MATPTASPSGCKTVGFFLLFVGFLCYVVGFAPPYWIRTFNVFDGSWYSAGLWMTCIGREDGATRCETTDLSVMPGWLRAVQVLQCLGLLGLAVSCMQGVISCCRSSAPSDASARYVKTMATIGLSGLSGFIGVMVYVGQVNAAYRESYSWAFGLDLAGCLLLIIASIIITVTHKMATGKSSAGSVYQTTNTGDTALVMQERGYPPPSVWMNRPLPPPSSYTPTTYTQTYSGGIGVGVGYSQHHPMGNV